MTIEAGEKTEAEEETNAEAETVTTPNVKSKEVDTKDEDSPNSHANIVTHMVAAHSSAECEPKGDMHQKIATTKNMQGGSNLNFSVCDDVGPI